MITDIEDFFTRGCGRCARFDTPDCSVKQWTAGLNDLRRICRSLKLEETVKWAHPCYMHAGRNIVLIGALRGDFRLSFFNAALMKDPDGVLERQGENTRHPDMIRFTRNDQVGEMEGIIRAYLAEAMAYAEQGLKPPKEEGGFDLPEELIAALDADPDLAEAFHALTPGRQKSYVIALSSAKTSQTRINRIAKYRDKIMAGKGAMER
ncbi:YdeI/OmpD-associated family protein [Hoeflea sp.]|uniref:YdeI/OmpD-associated family protein n=1 Tax=Hoeflea sp. TaxID=1940281 RepID=UPI0019A8261D|nr:YdeI/OmpD-associated family protein [Hoeflea sp.]MBC7283757.1 YdeI/OmpD-associated family protein [Hoeflea sp.]